jgi:hypothetical protein
MCKTGPSTAMAGHASHIMLLLLTSCFSTLFGLSTQAMCGRSRARAPEVDVDDPASIRRYNQWYSSHMYNA